MFGCTNQGIHTFIPGIKVYIHTWNLSTTLERNLWMLYRSSSSEKKSNNEHLARSEKLGQKI